jgi:GNAT superfamily N-acetyltransferase
MGAPETGRLFLCLSLGETPMIYLRGADRFDARALAELRAASLIEIDVLAPSAAAPFVSAAAGDFFTLFRTERIAAWIACDGDCVVGSSCAVFYDRLPYPDGSRHAELCGVYMRPVYRGRGFASELVREVIAATRAAGARKTFLRPTKKAKSLYERLGFVETELMLLADPSDVALPASRCDCGVAGLAGPFGG